MLIAVCAISVFVVTTVLPMQIDREALPPRSQEEVINELSELFLSPSTPLEKIIGGCKSGEFTPQIIRAAKRRAQIKSHPDTGNGKFVAVSNFIEAVEAELKKGSRGSVPTGPTTAYEPPTGPATVSTPPTTHIPAAPLGSNNSWDFFELSVRRPVQGFKALFPNNLFGVSAATPVLKTDVHQRNYDPTINRSQPRGNNTRSSTPTEEELMANGGRDYRNKMRESMGLPPE